ncbi:hypothetical protein [Peribacillus kribbensis]|nr:hypothetical protein [Peribacillus kribbensis]
MKMKKKKNKKKILFAALTALINIGQRIACKSSLGCRKPFHIRQ